MRDNEAFARNIKALREDNGLTQEEFGKSLSLGSSTVPKWERGLIVRPRPSMLNVIARMYEVSVDDLVSENGYYAKTRGLERGGEPKPSATSLPMAGAAHAGDPSQVFEVEGEEQWCPPEYAREGNFYVRVTGDSMNNCLMDGQCALIDTHSEVGSGDIALVKVNGDDATIKRVKLMDGMVVLEPDSTNPAHRRRIIDGTDPDSPDVRLIGKVVYAVTRL